MKPVFIICWLLSCTFGVYWVWQFYFWLNFSVSSVSMSLGESCFYRSTCMTLVGSERAPPGSANVFFMYPVFFIHSTKQTVFEISFFSSTWRSVNSFTLFFFYFLFLVYFRLFLLSQVSPRQLSSFFFSFFFLVRTPSANFLTETNTHYPAARPWLCCSFRRILAWLCIGTQIASVDWIKVLANIRAFEIVRNGAFG